MDSTPLTLSFDAGLDFALTRGWAGWIDVARKKGVERTTEWLLHRDETGLDPEELEPLVDLSALEEVFVVLGPTGLTADGKELERPEKPAPASALPPGAPPTRSAP